MADRDPWWRSATVYQIYVRSWRDSNGDGNGDLKGVADGLDYLEWLGVDCIWLSPTMPSPNTDWGYDVADYRGVQPDFGTLADMDNLVDQARQRGISVMLDLVPNHTSSAHPWFVDALKGPGSEHRNYYVWAKPKPDGSVPNNWLDATGGPAWAWDEASGEYYLHNFLATQPDLNWWEPRVHREFEQILRFWFDRGIAGFRIDVAHGLYKDALLRDNPPPSPTDHPVIRAGTYRPEFNCRRPEVHPLYQRWREVSDSYQPERALLGETWEFDPERFGAFYGREKPELHMNFNFTFVMADFGARPLAEVVEPMLDALPPGATPVWTASNHDVGRFPSRWCAGDSRAVRVALLVLAALPGTMVLYYGDELGMPDVDVPPEARLDEMSLAQPDKPGRDRCRTPMPWSDEPNGGFSAPGAVPWLPLGEHATTNVSAERADEASVLHFSRHLNRLRREEGLGEVAPLQRLWLDDQVWAFRCGPTLTVVNLSPRAGRCPLPASALPDGTRVLVATDAARQGRQLEATIELAPWEGLVAVSPE